MLVCDQCLRAIESREGQQKKIKVDVSQFDEPPICEWCEWEIEEGYEIFN